MPVDENENRKKRKKRMPVDKKEKRKKSKIQDEMNKTKLEIKDNKI